MNKNTSPTKSDRQAAVLETVRTEVIATQYDLVRALQRRHIAATQVSVSRDISEMGLIKLRGRYLPPSEPVVEAEPELPFRAWVASFREAGPHLIVIHCSAGTAPRIGLALDQSRLDGLVGTLAGDDTVFAATDSRAASRRLLGFLRARAPRP